ncbi:hypothetical protein B296_00037084 [Ensete ventricosum]|uniref:Uncharacterized protein n=1 Tax=Ensete ventricosum TaxID=4639 RepID=A0A426ZIJ4_ENSVE|nr:hypothetical protein B296_00037084 [Ensete ventricosum]
MVSFACPQQLACVRTVAVHGHVWRFTMTMRSPIEADVCQRNLVGFNVFVLTIACPFTQSLLLPSSSSKKALAVFVNERMEKSQQYFLSRLDWVGLVYCSVASGGRSDITMLSASEADQRRSRRSST